LTEFSQRLTPLVPANIQSTSGTKFNNCVSFVANELSVGANAIYFTNATANGSAGRGLGNILPRLNQLQNKGEELRFVFVTINSNDNLSLIETVQTSVQPLSAPFNENRVFGNPKIPNVESVVYLTKESGLWVIARIVTRNLEGIPEAWYETDKVKIDPVGGKAAFSADKLPYVSDIWLKTNFFDRPTADKIVDLLNSPMKQLILQGPPGTGKTYIAKELARELVGDENFRVVQFHPSYSYEDFVEGYRPVETGGELTYRLLPGALRRIVDEAIESPDQNFILIIDEINRGNLSRIFGELLFLLEYRNESITLQYSRNEGDLFSIPSNVFIVGTMNTSDRSIALVDAALRRRFWFLSFHPDVEPTKSLLSRWSQENEISEEINAIWAELNVRIDDPNLKLGPSYFMRRDIEHVLNIVWEQSIIPLLEEYFWDAPGIIQEKFGLLDVQSEVVVSLNDDLPPNDEASSGGVQDAIR
jgi:hypothetical protein